MVVTDTLRDAAYITVGVGVLGFQKAQVRRRELAKQLSAHRATWETQMDEGRRSLNEWAARLEDVVNPVVSEVEARLEDLPGAVREVVNQVRSSFGLT